MSAYEILKYPFRHKGQLVTLDTIPIPTLVNGTVVGSSPYPPNSALQMGLIGLKFNRMVSEETFLYDVMGIEAEEQAGPKAVGQILVVAPGHDAALDQHRFWMVEPTGLAEATNGFGAKMEVPEVQFWEYKGVAEQ